MHSLTLSPGFLCHAIKTSILAYLASVLLAASQGVFPRLENVGAFKKVSTVPTHATCGFPGPSTFCHSAVVTEQVQLCTERLCIQDCPYRSASPPYTALLEGLRSCIPADHGDLHPYSRSNATSFIFGSPRNCPPLLAARLAAEFTLAVWLKPEQGGTMCVMEKTVDGQIVFKVTISEKETMLYYRTVNGLQPPIKVMTPGRILMKKWIHLTVQVHQTEVSFFVDGLETNSTAFDTRTLHDSITDTTSSTIQVGQSLNGSEQFVGRMQDFRLYNVSLTNREILELFSGDFPHLHIQPHCRCPGSHPRVHPSVQQYCIPNGAEDTPQHRVSRLNPDAHPLSFINDDNVATSWISRVFANITQLHQGVVVSIDLENGQYQVYQISIQLSGPQPLAIRIQRKKADSSPWEDWQYFARHCNVWGMKDNGDLENPDSVNCLQLPDFIPFFHGNVTFDLLASGQKSRPGYNDFYNGSVLQEFMKATQIRLHFRGQYYPAGYTVDLRHQYYAVNEITVSGRCQCHGHAETCDRTSRPYRCLCSPHSFTEGPQCDRCSPLYNDKPFRSGDNVHAFNCKPCQCNSHASSCHYDASVDPFPLEHNRGGGGVCDDCQHHTTGRQCESCQDYFYRPVGADPAAPDVCKHCDCNRAGTRNGSLLCDPVGGQCDCKRHVSGRQCLRCQDGFYDLQALDPDGCRPCNCNPSGTVDGDITCHQNSGQCSCKANVIGLRCDRCNFGFKFLQSFNADGCEPCQCNLHGSVNQLCDPLSGQCACKKEAKGLKCDTCRENFYGLPWSACEDCDCSRAGSQPGTVCDSETGQCICKPSAGGRQCSQCKEGYVNLHQNDSHLCVPCNCEKTGTVNGSLWCDTSTGQCPCKLGVTGLRCHQCEPHRFNLTMGNSQGCQACECDTLGTLPGSTCDPVSGQCLCLPHRQGRRCERCQPGFYSSPGNATGCLPCSCHRAGSVSHICNSVTGQCSCHDPSITGRSCHQCQDHYFGFDPETGRCRPCNCHLAGASNETCDVVTGQCFCKEFVSGAKCDICVPGANHLDIDNLLGCSKTPSQQPPPRGWVQSSSAINLSWSPPDFPNAHRLTYTLFRDGSAIYTTEDQHPYYTQYFLDTSLSPHTEYSYYIETSNVHSLTRSIPVIYETKPEVSKGNLNLTHVIPVASDSVTLLWPGLSNHSGPVEKYILSCTPVDSTEPCVSYEGLEISATIWNLVPFTQYCFSVQGCTNESCLYSLPIIVTTAQAPPQRQGPPTVWKISPTELRVEWSPPVDPNGIIIRYELYMKRWPSTEESLVFESHGLVNSPPTSQSANQSGDMLQHPQVDTFISGLEPHTEYTFRVLAVNLAGTVSPALASERTGEAVPVFVAPPSVSPLSPHSLSVSWEKPAENFPSGEIIGYKISMVSEHAPQQDVPVVCSKLVHFAKSHKQSYTVNGLKPYRIYSFTVSFCTSVGCVTSALGSGQTLAAAPAQLRSPMVTGVNRTTVHIRWLPPAEVNGPPPLYHLERRESSLPAAPAAMTKGTCFVGEGYCRFPRTAHPDFIGIKASFRTRVPEGLILLALSPDDQEEYFALQLKNGRPSFLYNPQGSLVEVTTTDDDDSKQYSDGQWHEVIVIRHQASGQITLDGQYTGSSTSLNGSSVTGGYTGLFVGGLPQGHAILQKRLEIIQRGFVGCLKNVSIMKGYSPSETWLPLDWQSSEEQVNVYHSWEGSPTNLEEGVQFLGAGFLELRSDTFHAAKDFEISLKFQTDQLNGLLLFIHNTEGPDFLAMELKRGLLSLTLNSSLIFTRVDLRLGLAYCDGKWNTVSIKKEGPVLSVGVNELTKSASRAGGQPLLVDSPVYLGGIPRELQDSYRHLTLEPGFRGCVKEVAFTRGVVVNLASVSSRAVRVNQDGCLSSDSTVNCGGNDSILVYRGSQQSVYESGLQPFTEYLYRVTASHEGGSVSSDWSLGHTLGTAPQSVPTPSRAQSINGYSVEVAWDEPAVAEGVLEKYVLKAYSKDSSQPQMPAASTELNDTSTHSGILSGLHPFHSYVVTLTACSRVGCTESSHALSISTPQEAPQEVQAPVTVAFPNSLSFFWSPPKHSNGIITQYSLYMDGRLVYTGKGQNCTVTGLRVFTAHEITLGACTHVGCTNSSQVILHTAQLPPEQVDAPDLVVLDSRTIHAQWKQPRQLNGILERYILYTLNPTHNSTVWNAVYNSTETLQAHVLHHLSPGGRYLIKLEVCTGGGCTTSEPSQALMDETVPEGVPAPSAESYSPDSFNISWTEPGYPNGVITAYELYLDDALIHNSSELSCHVYGFDPGSLHTFQVQACTAKGCALGPLVENRTLEAPPEGMVNVLVKPKGSREAHVRWDAPARPNGLLTYSVHFTGSFYADQAGDNYTLLHGTKTIRSREGNRLQALVEGLVPYSRYTVQVNASNSRGSLLSDLVSVEMPPGAPDGLLSPRLAAATPTSLQVVWSTPARNNAPGSPRYQLQMRPGPSTHGLLELFPVPSASLSYEVTDLQPFTVYEFRVVATNSFGSAFSAWTALMTTEDKPGPIDAPILLKVKARTMSVVWRQPAKCNGAITHYNVYLRGRLYSTVSGSVTNCTVVRLHPHTAYHFQVEACTSQGCSKSPASETVWTLPGNPEGIPSPELFPYSPTAIIVTWQPPAHLDRLDENVTVERRVKGKEEVRSLVTFPRSQAIKFIDNDPALGPWTHYEYRVLGSALTGGANSSAWVEVTTRPCRPSGVQLPTAHALGPDTIEVTWKAPLIQNGDILSYEIRMPDPVIEITNVSSIMLSHLVKHLLPFTNYSITIVACSGGNGYLGGCTESLPTFATTHPALPQELAPLSVTLLSESYVGISWQPPSKPNGPNLRYELLRRKIQQPLASNPPEDLNLWHNIYSGTRWFYKDKGLSRFTTYEYKLFVHNSVGFTPTQEVTVTTLAGPPERGANVTASVLNHTAIDVRWKKPTFQDLQGDVEYYTLFWSSGTSEESLKILPDVDFHVINHLAPNMEYQVFLLVFNGVCAINSTVVRVTTRKEEPQGMLPPEVVVINSTAVRVIWTSPSNPNAIVTESSVYVNNKLYKTGTDAPGSLVLEDLSPFTIYDIQVEVCTKDAACVKSNGTQVSTAEDSPSDISIPIIRDITSRSLQINWTTPENPNGIILGYDVLRKTWRPCSETQTFTDKPSDELCKAVKCQYPGNVCGHTCYSPGTKVCCDGLLYDPQPGYSCCEEKYIALLPNATGVCCGGRMQETQPDHQCCSGCYTRILPGEICCPDERHNRVSVGLGDACCGTMPYATSGSQVCCSGRLQDGYRQQCCGGEMVSQDFKCCGGEEEGMVYSYLPGMLCCGQDYVNMSDTICCSASSGESKAHVRKDDLVPVKCCGTELIPESQRCCDGVGYDPLKYVCSDEILPGTAMKESRVCATVCPATMKATAHCGQCNFNATTHICTVMRGPLNPTGKKAAEGLCSASEEIVHSGDVNTRSFIDTDLKPSTVYEYRVSAWNSYGRGFSQSVRASTREDVPEGVKAPRWARTGNHEDVIFLQWKEPIQPNGPIIHYILLRDGRERFQGTALSFTDTQGIQPFQEYSYQLKVCTAVGCAISCKVVAASAQRIPESVPPPNITAQSSETLHLSWNVPKKTKDAIREYQLWLDGKGLIYTDTDDRRQHTVTGLQPYTNYSFTLAACTSAGCSSSEPSVGQTLQAAPQGVWVTPRHIIINSTAVELYWNPPERPNGLISQYQLWRNGSLLLVGGRDDQRFTDKNLEPSSRYIYKLEARTGGGSNMSEDYLVQTPMWTPEDVRPPCNVTVLGSDSIFVAWPTPGGLLPETPVEFSILLSGGRVALLAFSVGHRQSAHLKNLAPFTQYEIRIQACQNASCGVSSGTYVRTGEAAPAGLVPPLLKALGSHCIDVRWTPPTRPNGIITGYIVHRRPADTEEESLLFVWSEGALEFTDDTDTLQPFTLYEYQVRAWNSKGAVDSPWSSVQTLEAPPQHLSAPWIQVTSAHSVLLNWTEPEAPNGLISQYHVIYQERPDAAAPSKSTVHAFSVTGESHQAHLFGLEPFRTYHIGVVAVNSAGKVSSPWTLIKTLESAPSGLRNFTVEQRENGQALLLRWSEPVRTNGVIKAYNIFSDGLLEYSGLGRQFLFRRLAPFTLYTLTLEACTAAGCAHSVPQPVWTEEAPPDSQMAPTIQSVEPTTVRLHWSQPANPNGKIIRYEVIRRHLEGEDWGDTASQADEYTVCTEHSPEGNGWVCNDTGLQPWRQYAYRICTWNSAGHTCSSWNVLRTLQAPPDGLSPPEIAYVSMRPLQVLISWLPPQRSNGVIQSYRLQRNALFPDLSFNASTFSYTDNQLLPFSTYSYAILACTGGGCYTSEPTNITTPEAPPSGVSPPVLVAISAHQINVSWSPPSIPNGKIVKYLLQYAGEEHLAGRGLSFLLSNLQPCTQYNISLVACTDGGCTASRATSAWTMEAPPENMDPPTLHVTGPESIEITWMPPRSPHGHIRSYELRRDGAIVYAGLETRYHDFTLAPGVEYGYSVTATNSRGSVLSTLVKGQTSPLAPSGLQPPKLRVRDALELLADWDPPVRTNGKIVNYTLFVRELLAGEARTIDINTTHSSFGTRSLLVKHLKPFHRYEARVQACTALGCTSSEWTSIQTPEVPPLMQPAPHLEVQTAAGGFQPIVAVWWAGPLQPNGKIVCFELYRRQTVSWPGTSSSLLIYNGSLSSFKDLELLPFTEYEYQVWAVNSAGKAASTWTWCRTGPAPPEGLKAPIFHTVSSTQAVVNISAPSKPNGIISLFRVFSNSSGMHVMLSEGTTTQQTLHDLRPFTTYAIGVEACTCFNCCSRGPTAELRTHPAPPSGLSPPQIQTLGSRMASFQWTPPQLPNGVIHSYELQLHRACPPESAPHCPPSHTERKYWGPGHRASLAGLQPDTAYEVQVVAHNEAGSTASGWTSFSTKKEMPQYQALFSVNSNASMVWVDWSDTFVLNGRLKEYVVTDGGRRVYSGLDTTLHIPRTVDKPFFFQVTCTTDIGSVKTPLVQYDAATGFGLVLTTPGDRKGAGTKSTEFYSELWFIMVMAMLALILLAIFLSLILQRKIHKEPCIRERPPLVPLQKRMTPLSSYPPGETHVGLADTRLPRSGTPLSIRSSQSVSVLRIPSQSQLSHAYSQGSLHRSVSQLMDIPDKKVVMEDSLWETIMGHSSGLYVDEEELMNAIKGFSSVTKEHTAFTDTHL
ncbi:usherin [Apodemus sylvaticus]|uniref:usherin n=1 Tax=Apodemus sylvaticus TaxID=10129 RepID=UPI0022423BA3|nr:usherin [Apodemus sylvaticus]